MRKSKYLGTCSGDWTCTHVGVASVQSTYCKYKLKPNGKKARTKSRGSQQYYYIYERPVANGRQMEMIRLNASQALLVRKGEATVEYFASKKRATPQPAFKNKVSYSYNLPN